VSAPQTAEFIAEAKEHLAEVCDQLLRLETCSGDAARDRVEQMLRAVHSVKGGAGYFGLRHIEMVAHKMETTVEAILNGTTQRDSRTVDTLLAATDRIAALLDDIERSDSIDVDDVIVRLDELSVGKTPSKPAALPEEAAIPSRSKKTARAPNHQFPIAIDLCACEAMGLSLLEVVGRVQTLGQISEGTIGSPDVDLEQSSPIGPVVWRATVASELSVDEFDRQLGVPQYVAEPETAAPAAVTVAPVSAGAPVAVERNTTIRIPVILADRLMNLAGELVLVRNQSRRFADARQPLPASVVQRFDAVTSEFQETVLQTRMQPIGNLFNKFPRLVRDLARQLDKQIELHISGAEVELDKTILDAISDPLTHLMRNACDHGAERPEVRDGQGKSATVRIDLTARHSGDQIFITVADDGRGIDRDAVLRQAVKQGLRTTDELSRLNDRELLALILMPGFSTAAKVTDVSGRGVGMDVVKTNITQLGGSVEIESVVGKGTTFTLRLPLTVAIIPGLLVTVSNQRYVIPQKDLEELVCVESNRAGENHGRVRIEWTKDQEVVRLRGRLLPLLRLAKVLQSGPKQPPDETTGPMIVAVVKAGSRRYGLVIDSVISNEEIVVKPMHNRLRTMAVYSGATILGDGSVALILNTAGIAVVSHARFGTDAEMASQITFDRTVESKTVLLLRQTNGEAVAVPATHVRRIVMVSRNQYERIGEGQYVTIDGIPTRVFSLGPNAAADSIAEGISFVLLPRDGDQAIGYVVSAVLGTEQIHLDDVHPFSADPTALGVAVVRGGITPLIDLQCRQSDAIFRESSVAARRIPTGPSRVLIVDDTQFFRDVVGRYLTEAGYRVTAAEHGAAGLDLLQRETFDLVVSDIEMPVMDGFALAAAVRQMDALQQLPMLALSTLVGEEVKAKALAHGFDAYQVKLDQASLLTVVHELLERRNTVASAEEVCDAK
jgi:two-component system chemotaxis sensor kinase CheA